MKKISISLLLMFAFLLASAQQDITLEDIWKDGTFSTKGVAGFNFLNDGRHYTRLEDNKIKKYDITTGEWVADVFDAEGIEGQMGFDKRMSSYSFNSDETKILITSERESIYRRSFLAKYHVYDLAKKELHAIYEEGKVLNATFSPDSRYVGYVFDNNLYYYDLDEGMTLPITFDGERNKVINGLTDWVYEEEFGLVKAFWWSPDSKKIAYLRFDESEVPEYTMAYHRDEAYPDYYTFKYPKVGAKNSNISAHVYSLDSEKSKAINMEKVEYIPRVKWTQNPDEVCLTTLNRHQNHLQLLIANVADDEVRVLLDEKNKYYIDVNSNLTFLKDGKSFIWMSEKDGYKHIYRYDMNGKEICDLTEGDFDVTSFYGVDEANDRIYYQAAKESPMNREVYEVNTNGKKLRKMTEMPGSNTARFSSTYDYYTLINSTANSPASFAVYDRKGNLIRTLEDNAAAKTTMKKYGVAPMEFFTFTTSEGVDLNGWMIKPKNFDPNKEYPLFMTQYSGPGSQQVTDSWKGSNYWWYQMLAQQGYIVACVDGRGTGARGEEFKKMTYLQLGKYETMDQIEAAKYLGSQSYMDADRIGIFGWSYGGYMSSLCMFKGADVFTAGIAVAPVTNWKWYDTVYTERYMRTTEDNAEGYKENSPVYFADQLKGKFLLVHGAGDDNVHLQNSMEMANALISANKQFDMYFYPNRNHGIYGDNARLHLYTKMTNFLNENLKGE